jgi:hypothetical protein
MLVTAAALPDSHTDYYTHFSHETQAGDPQPIRNLQAEEK